MNALLPGVTGWRQAAVDSLPPAQRHAWEALCPGGIPWQAEAELAPRFGQWDCLVVIGRSPSSQFDALQSARERGRELPDSLACLALEGERFHGQRGRPWVALRGNLHLTTHHAVGLPAAWVGIGFSLLPTVALVDALRESGGGNGLGIKWVNDVQINGNKIAGVLAAASAQGEVLEHVVLGAGLNVAVSPQVSGDAFVPAAGCLRELWPGEGRSLAALLPRILRAFDGRHRELCAEGPRALLHAYREYSCCLGRDVSVWSDPLEAGASRELLARGRLRHIGDDLALHLAGHDRPISRGRLVIEG